MTNQCKFKVGDKVKRKDGKLFTNGEKVVTVSDILCWYGHYWVEYANKRNYLHEDELELSVFTKSDLKDGMVVTYREGEERVVYKNYLLDLSGVDSGDLNMGGMLDTYNSDITRPNYKNLDIMKVTYMDEVLWEREEESADQKRIKELEEGIAKMQEELNKLL